MNKLEVIDLCSVFGKVETFAFGHNELFVRDYESSSNTMHFCGRSFKKLINTSTSCALHSIRKALQMRKQKAESNLKAY